MSDQYYDKTSLLLPMNSVTGFVDQSPVQKSVTVTNAVISSASSQYYGYAGYFDGTSDYLRVSYSAFTFGYKDFTIEFWINLQAHTGYPFIMASGYYAGTNGFYITADGASTSWGGTGVLSFSGATDVLNRGYVTSTTPIRTYGWKHIAITRQGIYTRLFVDGTLESTHTAAGIAYYYYDGSPGISKAAETDGANDGMFMSDVRITIGVARYTATFTAPSALHLPLSIIGTVKDIENNDAVRRVISFPRYAVTRAREVMSSILCRLDTDTYAAQTVLALPMNGSNNGTTFTDWSPTPKTVTRYNAVTSTTQSNYYGSSGYFDGVGDYLTVPAGSTWSWGTADFCVEVWVYPTYRGAIPTIIFSSGGPSSPLWYSVRFQILSTGYPQMFVSTDGGYNATGYATSSVTAPLNTWVHIAGVRYGNNIYIYVDGVQRGSAAISGTIYYGVLNAPHIGVGQDYSVAYFYGYLQDLRITKGVARYTADFTPPTKLGMPGYKFANCVDTEYTVICAEDAAVDVFAPLIERVNPA